MDKIRVYAISLVITVSIALVISVGSSAEPSQETISALGKQATSTLALVAAFSGKQIARLAMGESIQLDELSEGNLLQVADAVKAMYPRTASSWGPEDQWRLRVSTYFSITFRSKVLGENGELTIQLESFVPSLDPRVKPASSGANEAKVANVPALGSILANAPVDSNARASYLGKSLFALMEPLGELALTKAHEIPFTLSDFVDAKKMSVTDLNKRQLDWIMNVYSQFYQRAIETAGSFRFTEASPDYKRVVNGIPEEWLYRQPQEWSSLDDVTVQPMISYFPVIVPSSAGPDGPGCGWIIRSGMY